MLESIFGNKTAEIVLLYIYHYKEIHASAIAKFSNSALNPVQNQLHRFEKGGILLSKPVGRSRLYFFNPKSPFVGPVKELVRRVYEFIPLKEKEKKFPIHYKARQKGKSIL